jgi:ATP-dependent RNA helicase DHX37/DHR1
LPIYFKEAEIVEAIQHNLVTIICGETGCGKSTQLPQFLLEAGFAVSGTIAVTQPRRLPTISLAKRVAAECNLVIGREVAYQVRHQSSEYHSD